MNRFQPELIAVMIDALVQAAQEVRADPSHANQNTGAATQTCAVVKR